MLKNRHEEHIPFVDRLPYSLHSYCRTPAKLTHEHNWHENLEFHLYLDGNATLLLDGKNFSLGAHDVVAIDSNAIHYCTTVDCFEYRCLIIDTAFLKQMHIDYVNLHFCPVFRDETVERLFDRLWKAHTAPDETYRVAKCTSALIDLLLAILEFHTAPKMETRRNERPNAFEDIKHAITYIRNNFEKKLSLDGIAQAAYVDKFYLSRAFKQLTGKTVIEYINDYRCRRAAEYIIEGKHVSEAALECGFENMSYFTKTFKKHIGTLPSQYADKNRN